MPDLQSPSPSWFPIISHKVDTRIYNLSAGLNYVSIKDQVVRACALVDSLFDADLLTELPPPGWDLVVIGAGAAGVTAAWRAASLGKNVLVVEQSETAFPAQIASNDRVISFSMYDWPEAFASVGTFPSLNDLPVKGTAIDADSFPCFSVEKKPKQASAYAKEWLTRLDFSGTKLCSSTAKRPITWMFSTRAEVQAVPKFSYDDSVKYPTVQLLDLRTNATKVISAGTIILATGLGSERRVGSYLPPPFWTDNKNSPWSTAERKIRAGKKFVISGAGDGAIQDVLKTLLSIRVRDLIPVAEALLPPRKKSASKQSILAAERHAERQLLWGVPDTNVYAALQSVYDAIVVSAAADHKTFEKWRRSYLCPEVRIDWILGEHATFSKSYPLNRLLGTAVRHLGKSINVVGHAGNLVEVESEGGSWLCRLSNGVELRSDYPPVVRHGVETADVDVTKDFDLQAIRSTLSRAPVPFKPYDF